MERVLLDHLTRYFVLLVKLKKSLKYKLASLNKYELVNLGH